jgi:hypothetical protein
VNFVIKKRGVEMLRTTLIFCTMFMAVGTANAEPLKLTDTQMDMVTAGDLYLPNGKHMFQGFDNAAPGEFHPYFLPGFAPRKGFTMSGNEGPWSAHQNSPVITCPSCGP